MSNRVHALRTRSLASTHASVGGRGRRRRGRARYNREEQSSGEGPATTTADSRAATEDGTSDERGRSGRVRCEPDPTAALREVGESAASKRRCERAQLTSGEATRAAAGAAGKRSRSCEEKSKTREVAMKRDGGRGEERVYRKEEEEGERADSGECGGSKEQISIERQMRRRARENQVSSLCLLSFGQRAEAVAADAIRLLLLAAVDAAGAARAVA